jgi:nucleotide-binding universal stress UspA family protein
MEVRPLRRILVGWDCSPGAVAALRAAAALAADRDAAVVVLAVLKSAPRTDDAAEGAADFDERTLRPEDFRKGRGRATRKIAGTRLAAVHRER